MTLIFGCDNIQDFLILRFHDYTSTIILLSTITKKGCTWFLMVSVSMEDRYEK